VSPRIGNHTKQRSGRGARCVDMADIPIAFQRGLPTLCSLTGLVLQKVVFVTVFGANGAMRRSKNCYVSKLQRIDPSWSARATTGKSRRVKLSQPSEAILTTTLRNKLKYQQHPAKTTAKKCESLLPNQTHELPPARSQRHRIKCRNRAKRKALIARHLHI
jgi:hypothetical protein